MDIIISRGDKNAERVPESGVEREDYLQRYISDNPGSLPLDDIQEDLRLMVIGREFSTASGPIDILAVDGDGIIYVIETKLYKNPDKRLVIAQMLDYGAALWRGFPDPSQFVEQIDAACMKSSGKALLQRLIEFTGLDENQAAEIVKAIRRSVGSGKFRFLVLMDHIEPRLKDLVLFLNQQTGLEFYAVEMRFYRYEGLQIAIPTLHGAEVTKSVGADGGAGSIRRKWNEQTFFDDAKARLALADLGLVQELYTFSQQAADRIDWGTGPSVGSFNPKFVAVCPRSPYSVCSDGNLKLNFGWFDRNDGEKSVRDRFAKRLQEAGFAALPADWEASYLNVPLSQWKTKRNEFTGIVREIFVTAAR